MPTSSTNITNITTNQANIETEQPTIPATVNNNDNTTPEQQLQQENCRDPVQTSAYVNACSRWL